jgi:L-lactate utilization protein LutC
MEQRWQDTDKIINKLKSHQIGKTPEQIAQELQNHRLHMENLNRRKADKVFRDMEKQQRKTKIQDMRTTLRQMEQVVIKQQSMMDCSSAILQRQVELLQFTIAEVKRQSALTREIDEEMKNILGKINKLQL